MNATENFEYDIEFFNREKEKQEILNILKTKPQLINFIYGPINSGKTTLIQKLIDDLSKDKYAVFYINLRGKLIKEYGGFVRVLFKIKKKETSERLTKKGKNLAKNAIILTGRYLSGIPIEKDMLDGFLETESSEDVFEFLEEYFLKISETKIPILIIDELQVIGDLEINGKAIYKLFNFFIRLTKELHICHVFTLSSDSLFIEKVYNEAMLQGRCNYLLVDDFDEETTKKFLEKYNISKEEQDLAWNYFGGKPGILTDYIGATDKNRYVKQALTKRKNEIKAALKKVKELGEEIIINGKPFEVNYSMLLETLNKFNSVENVSANDISEIPKRYFVNQNIFFVDCNDGYVKTQSKVDLLAIREILKEMK